VNEESFTWRASGVKPSSHRLNSQNLDSFKPFLSSVIERRFKGVFRLQSMHLRTLCKVQ
jgi:hypothetical protein